MRFSSHPLLVFVGYFLTFTRVYTIYLILVQTNPLFYESFDLKESGKSQWITSKATKNIVDRIGEESTISEYKYNGQWNIRRPDVYPGGSQFGDSGLVLEQPAQYYAVSRPLEEPLKFTGTEPFVLQYEVKLQNGLECGGAYMKLFTETYKSESIDDHSPYSIMFGPDRCGQNDKVTNAQFFFRFILSFNIEIQ